jgi:hypothetical protein
VRSAEYGTLLYTLRLELRKQSLSNLCTAWLATAVSTGGTLVFWAAALSTRPTTEGCLEVLFFAATDAKLLYAAPGLWVCIISGGGQYDRRCEPTITPTGAHDCPFVRQVFGFLCVPLLTLTTGVIITGETGFLTPASLKGVPDIRLPTSVHHSSETTANRLLKLASLKDEQVRYDGCWSFRVGRPDLARFTWQVLGLPASLPSLK